LVWALLVLNVYVVLLAEMATDVGRKKPQFNLNRQEMLYFVCKIKASLIRGNRSHISSGQSLYLPFTRMIKKKMRRKKNK